MWGFGWIKKLKSLRSGHTVWSLRSCSLQMLYEHASRGRRGKNAPPGAFGGTRLAGGGSPVEDLCGGHPAHRGGGSLVRRTAVRRFAATWEVSDVRSTGASPSTAVRSR